MDDLYEEISNLTDAVKVSTEKRLNEVTEMAQII